jgi:CRP-like cAMP-binding protein
MISPELLRRYPFFGAYSEAQLREIAMISEEITVEAGVKLFEECDAADALYVLMDGGVDLYFHAKEAFSSKPGKEFPIGEINPGEVFSISAVLEPYELSSSGRTSRQSRIIKIDAPKLRQLFLQDQSLDCITTHQAARVLMERLAYTRVQLAAAWA